MNRIPVQNGFTKGQPLPPPQTLKKFRTEIVFAGMAIDQAGNAMNGVRGEVQAFDFKHAVEATLVQTWAMPIKKLTVEAVESQILVPS